MEEELKYLQPENLTVETFRAEGMPIDREGTGMRITDNVLHIQIACTHYDQLRLNRQACIAGLLAATNRIKQMSGR